MSLVFFNYLYKVSFQSDNPLYNEDIIIYYIVLQNISPPYLCSLSYSSPIRGELKIRYFGRNYLQTLVKYKLISMPITYFINAFSVYRNIYYSLLGIYLLFGSLNQRNRSRYINIFILTLRPFTASFKDIIGMLRLL